MQLIPCYIVSVERFRKGPPVRGRLLFRVKTLDKIGGVLRMPALRSLKHERFCNEYTIDFNATQAATRTGYSEKTARVQGSKLLTNPAILSRVRELQAEQVERLSITADWVMLKLIEVVAKAMQAEPVMKWDREEKRMVETGEYVFDSPGANKALELVGKHLGMYTDKVELKGKVDSDLHLLSAKQLMKLAGEDDSTG